jgi:uncharacterized membrane protein
MKKYKGFLTNQVHDYDPVWHVQVAIIIMITLQLALPDHLIAGPRFFLPFIESFLLLALIVTTPREPLYQSTLRRLSAIGLIVLIGIANIYSLQHVASLLLAGGHISNGRELILASLNIYLTNLMVFGLLYWEMDGGGPGRRRGIDRLEQDFLYPQQVSIESRHGWHPTFIDYLYVSATNATAFSPTDTMPLSRRAKMLMLIQSVVSLITIALVAARAVNILS